jgi:hypothetical protein
VLAELHQQRSSRRGIGAHLNVARVNTADNGTITDLTPEGEGEGRFALGYTRSRPSSGVPQWRPNLAHDLGVFWLLVEFASLIRPSTVVGAQGRVRLSVDAPRNGRPPGVDNRGDAEVAGDLQRLAHR